MGIGGPRQAGGLRAAGVNSHGRDDGGGRSALRATGSDRVGTLNL